MRARAKIILGLLAVGVFVLIARPAQALTIITNDIIANTTWNLVGSPYVVQNDIIVDFGATLTIDPGVIVKFSGPDSYSFSDIEIYGKLIAEGTADKQIYFTGFLDDSVGGDTNGDGPPVPNLNAFYGRWGGLTFIFADVSSIKNANFYWARTALFVAGTDLNISDSGFENNFKHIYAGDGSEILATNLTLFNSKYESILISESFFTGGNILIEDTRDLNAINIWGGSDLTLSNSIIRNNNSNISVRVDESDIHFSGVSIDNIPGYGVSAGGPAIIDLNNVTITNINSIRADAISAYFPGTVLNVIDSVFDTGGRDGIGINDNVIADIENTVIKNFDGAGLSDWGGVTINLDGVQIFDNNYGVYSEYDSRFPDSVYYATNSVISGNALYGAWADVLTPIDLSGVWWGDASGPYHPVLNPAGLGNEVSDNVLFDPWCLNASCAARDPVILIPGITGTRINKNYDDYGEIWPDLTQLILSFTDSFLNDLALLPDGAENPDFPMTLDDIIREASGTHIFDGLISELTNAGYAEGTDLFVFPYDWRKSNTDNAVLLKNKIDQVLAGTGRPKVDIIAHSMGGLLAKKYIADENADKIDQLIFIGAPHLGAPKAFKALMYGDDMGFGVSTLLVSIHILSPNRIRVISQNMPAVYELLPGGKYVDGNTNFIGRKYVYDAITSNSWLDYAGVKDFMIGQGRNSAMFPFAESLHDSIDDLDLSGVNVTNFAGCGNTKTVGAIIAKKKKSKTSSGTSISNDYKIEYVNGDSTVPLFSSSGPYGNEYYVKNISHTELPSGSGPKESALAILQNQAPAGHPNISRDINDCYISGKVVSAHSPVELHIYDDADNHTGPNADGDIEYGIPGVTYDEIEGSKFAFLPDGVNYRVVNRATDTGAYNFYLEEINGVDKKTGEYYWDEIPLDTLLANSEILVGPGISDYVIKMDEDGDGFFEKEFTPSSSLNAAQAGDLTAPETTNAILDGEITLSAADDNAGVLKTEYSLDGENWLRYFSPLNIAGATIKYFSTDNAGNIEEIKEASAPAPVPPSDPGGVVLIISSAPNNTVSESAQNTAENIQPIISKARVIVPPAEVQEPKEENKKTEIARVNTIQENTPAEPAPKEQIELLAAVGKAPESGGVWFVFVLLGGVAVVFLSRKYFKA